MALAERTNAEALRRAVGVGTLLFGAGAFGRGLVGLKELFRPRGIRPGTTGPRPVQLDVAVPEEEEEEEEAHTPVPRLRLKSAQGELKLLPAPQSGIGILPGENEGDPYIVDQAINVKPEGWSWADWFLGKYNPKIMEKPWFLTTTLGLGGLGAYGGWKLADKILDWRRESDIRQELEEAKEEYRRALISQHSADKAASAGPTLDEALGTAYELVKSAGFGDWLAGQIRGWGGLGANFYLPIAAMLAGISGLGAYHFAKGRSPEERVAKAIKQRERLRWAIRPPEIYAVPRPQRRLPEETAEPEEEDVAENVLAVPSLARAKAAAAEMAALYKPHNR